MKQGLVCATCVITLAITPTLGPAQTSFHPGILRVVLHRRRKGCNSLLARNRDGRGAGDYSLEVDSPAMINAGPQIRSWALPFLPLPLLLLHPLCIRLRPSLHLALVISIVSIFDTKPARKHCRLLPCHPSEFLSILQIRPRRPRSNLTVCSRVSGSVNRFIGPSRTLKPLLKPEGYRS